MSTVISIENLSKYYRLGLIGGQTLREDVNSLIARLRGKPDPLTKVGGVGSSGRKGDQLWALKNINLEIQQGEILGVIGGNGAGKSTLLKILSKITAPTEGRAWIKGRVGSLLEVGTGFHMELTGRENIYLNGAILGMKRAEITRKLDEIIGFAGMNKFIDTPVKRYSSGMGVRLAFAVAAHLEPEIMIVDEVLAVGDAEFQHKCLGKMKDVAGQGRTVLFVSHNLSAVSRLCHRGVWLEKGRIKQDGDVHEVLNAYEKSITQNSQRADIDQSILNNDVTILDVEIVDKDNPELSSVRSEGACRIVIKGVARHNLSAMGIAIGVYGDQGKRLSLIESNSVKQTFDVTAGKFCIYCDIDRLPLVTGRYTINVALKQEKNLLDVVERAAVLNVENADFVLANSSEYGPISLNHRWLQV